MNKGQMIMKARFGGVVPEWTSYIRARVKNNIKIHHHFITRIRGFLLVNLKGWKKHEEA